MLRVDKNGKLQPDLAEKVDVSADGLTYTATLRDDLKYSDGTKLTAEDFVYTWQRMVDPATASEYAYLASDSHLVNAADIIVGRRVLKSWVLRLRVIKLSLPCQILLHNLRVFCHSQILFHKHKRICRKD